MLALGMVSVKKVKNRSAALSPWSAMTAGRMKPVPRVVTVPLFDALTSSVPMSSAPSNWRNITPFMLLRCRVRSSGTLDAWMEK